MSKNDLQIPPCCRTGSNSSCSNSTYVAIAVRERVAVYGAIMAFAILLNFARIIMFFWVAHKAACTLHSRMLLSLLEAVPRFFDAIPIGTHVFNQVNKNLIDIFMCYLQAKY